VQYLVGWGNRLGTMYTWARALYLSKSRGHRIISFQTTGYEVGGQRILVRSVQPRPAGPQDIPAATTPAVAEEGGRRSVRDT
jgi:NADH:ubiquinone reductase (H+-translocating)